MFRLYNEILEFQRRLSVNFSAEMKGQYSGIFPSLDLQTLSLTLTFLFFMCALSIN